MKRPSSTDKMAGVSPTVREVVGVDTIQNRFREASDFCVAPSAGEIRKGKSLPPLTSCGHLPEGIYESTLEEVVLRFANSAYRKNLWEGATKFLALATEGDGFSHAYLAGGFISAKVHPEDIDLILQPVEPYGVKAFKAMEPLFALGLDSIYRKYAVHLHFWCDAPPQAICDFREFFQLLRSTNSVDADEGAPETRRGLVKLSLR